MSIYSQPYTYLIGWTAHRKFYYGVRYAKGCHPSDLWQSYFTSSRFVKKLREEVGEPDVIEVRKTFASAEEARDWEHRVLKRINAVVREDFLNRSNAKAASNLGMRQPESMRRRLSELFKGKPGRKWTEEQKRKASATHTGMKFTEQHRANISKARIGMKFSEAHRANISSALTPEQRAEVGRKISESKRLKKLSINHHL